MHACMLCTYALIDLGARDPNRHSGVFWLCFGVCCQPGFQQLVCDADGPGVVKAVDTCMQPMNVIVSEKCCNRNSCKHK